MKYRQHAFHHLKQELSLYCPVELMMMPLLLIKVLYSRVLVNILPFFDVAFSDLIVSYSAQALFRNVIKILHCEFIIV